ncbi:hypothetical protein, conserved [Trypanosoma brucei gambiense DAL972]|uniref:Uncharacterized protein n=2 Tax=Trypanosoma brucei TaxID=5691 RepID=C9ZS76_TRYB9|nr:hypothetical protein, conserved [Trypanosoma brucei gambiense DAL972]RHW71363.1 hypothetical protein DPX39_070030200 [Trypanosoma brucei equiperdum]CBH12212.1 hypothetical protein, conserved [Trypanosoma brucei gambiense DAL972]|eukprot:XP_011774495.1 hypothetical protein, conserved [Trypanosoma brucei gambiense DAL972]
MSRDATPYEGEGDDDDYDGAMRCILVEKIRRHRALEREGSVRVITRKGVPPPTLGELCAIADRRSRHEDLLRLQRRLDGVERRMGLWRDYLSYEPPPFMSSSVPANASETGILEGRAALLSPLSTLFRILLRENRARERLRLLRARPPLPKSQTPSLASARRMSLEVARFVGDDIFVPPGDGCRSAITSEQLLVTPAYEVERLRNPLVFLAREYRMERLPEFSLNPAKSPDTGHSSVVRKDCGASSAVTLSDFRQPPVMLEAFNIPCGIYDVGRRVHLIQGYEPLYSSDGLGSLDSLSKAVKCRRDGPQRGDTAFIDGRLSQSLWCSGTPAKLRGPLQEDSLSGSDDDEVSPAFCADVSWLPKFPE